MESTLIASDYLPTGIEQLQHGLVWTLALGGVLAFLLGFGMGANDVSNTFGTSVGSKVLTLRKAYILAAIFETLGALLVGSNVTDTMRKGVVDIEIYTDEPRVLLLGQLAILGGCASWLLLATFFELPVSTTHSVVGATIGFSLCARGFLGINWNEIIHIALSWIISPVLSGLISCTLYLFVDISILRQKEPFECGLRLLPFFYFVCISFNTFVVRYQGSQISFLPTIPLYTALLISLGFGIVAALLCHFILKPRLISWINQKTTIVNVEQMVRKSGSILSHRSSIKAEDCSNLDGVYVIEQNPTSLRRLAPASLPPNGTSSPLGLIEIPIGEIYCIDPVVGQKRSSYYEGSDHVDVNTVSFSELKGKPILFRKNRRKSELVVNQGYVSQSLLEWTPKGFFAWLLPAKNRTEDKKTLKLFSSIQVFTACFAGFAHGANDVSNAIAPLTALLSIYKTMDVRQSEPTPIYVLIFGVVSICTGLFILGHKVIRTVGQRMSSIHAASNLLYLGEFGAAVTTLVASKLGLPVSTTHSLIGSIALVGTIKAGEGIRWSVFRNIVLSWVITLPVTALISTAMMFLMMKLQL